MNLAIGHTLGKYRILEHVGRGGAADVYKAVHPGLGRFVAVKVLHTVKEDPNFISRFRREALAVASLRHTNIIQVFDFDIEKNMPYMVLEFVEGITLMKLLDQRYHQKRKLDISETLFVMQALCSAVGYAHEQGIIHRDLKPENVMLTSDKRIILADFGIARIAGGKRVTGTGQISGTPEYMSPEHARGRPGDQRMDIYSLGIMLYEFMMGDVPFQASSPLGILEKQIAAPLPRMRSLNPALHPEMEEVIAKALAKLPESRFQTADEMWTEIRRIYPNELICVQPDFFPEAYVGETAEEANQRAQTYAHVPTLRETIQNFLEEGPVWSKFALVLLFLNAVCLVILLIRMRSGASVGRSSPIFSNGQRTVSTVLEEGAAELRRLDFAGAEKTFAEALKMEPDTVPAIVGRAEALFAMGRNSEAEFDVSRALTADPKSAGAHLLQVKMTLTHNPKADWKAIQSEIEAAIQQEPNLPEGHYVRGWASLYYYTPEKPVSFIFPMHCVPEFQSAVASGHAEQALADLQKAAKMEPRDYRFHLALADAYFATTAYRPAVQEIDQVLKLLPNYFPAVWRRVILNILLEDYQASVQDLNAILASPQASAQRNRWLAWRALANYRRGSYTEAMNDAETLLKATPDNPEALYVKGLVLYSKNKMREALPVLEKVAARPPAEYACPFLNVYQGNEINVDIGNVLAESDRPSDALSRYAKALALHPDWYAAHLYRGQTYAQMKQLSAAREDFKRALALAPDDSKRAVVKKELAALDQAKGK